MSGAPDTGTAPAATAGTTLGEHTAGQLRRLGGIAGLSHQDTESYARALAETLGATAERPLALPPPSSTFLSDDHTPVEFSLAFRPGAPPTLRVLVDPGCAAGGLAEGGRTGLAVVRGMAHRWTFPTAQLEALEDLFFPRDPRGPLALWYAWELRPGGVPRVKVYLNPGARGPEPAAATVREALERLGHRRAFEALPPADGHPFLALDLGDWEAPRVKVYLRHDGLSAAEAPGLNRMAPAAPPDGRVAGAPDGGVEDFLRIAAGRPPRSADPAPHAPRLTGRPALTCHSFTDTAVGAPSGFTLHVPVRDYVPHDAEAHTRARTLLRRLGIDGT
ncbi:prenyltransferase, partial [Streptomyces boncukensis]